MWKQKNNKSEITTAFLKNEGALRSFIARFVVRPADVDDISQEVFMRAFRAEKKTTIRNPKAFLFRTAKNVALNELTRKSNILTDYIEDSCSTDVLAREKPVDEQYDDRQKFSLFSEAVSTLPPQCQRVFVMRKVYGFSQKEISQELGISTSTVEKHVASGLVRCRDYMRQAKSKKPVKHLHTKNTKAKSKTYHE